MARIKIYVQRIVDGRMTIDEVPEKYREAVRKMIEEM